LEFDGQSATVQPAPIVHQLELGKFKFAPVVHRAFGSIARFGLPMMELQYTTQFENQFTGPVTLVLEPGSIRGDCIIAINGDQSLLPAPVDVHIRGSLGAEITHLLHSGTNTIIIRIRTDRVDGGLLNCLYLAGDFGVGLNPLRLTARPQLGSFGQWENSGLPFFAGVVEYRGSIALNSVAPLIEIPIDPVLLGDDACEVCFNDGAWHAMLWNPRLIRPNPGELHPGENPFRLRVYTTLLRAFEGQRFDPISHGGVGITGL
jgi:hypothetical protein